MQIAVIGLWHLGTVTAACLCKAGYHVVGYDPNRNIIEKLQNGLTPIFEPHLEDLLQAAQTKNLIIYSNCLKEISNSEIIWIAFDTPVDSKDVANVQYVIEQVQALQPYIQDNALVLISSQIPVGTTDRLQKKFDEKSFETKKNICFAYIPENLRLGKAIDVFMNPDRIVVGLNQPIYKNRILNFLKPFSENIIFMSVASAEMTKHAINTFLALSVTFINELAVLCETVGANAYEVEQGLKSEERIGPQAYLRPGDAIAGGTLMRDINFLIQLGEQKNQNTHLFSAVLKSNRVHEKWIRQKLKFIYPNLDGKKIAILGLTYKADTNTLRRSSAIETCQWLFEQGCEIRAFDPSLQKLPPEFAHFIQLQTSYYDAILNADAIVIATVWPQFRVLMPNDLITDLNQKITVIDPNGCLAKNINHDLNINYFSVGNSSCNFTHVPQSSQAPVVV